MLNDTSTVGGRRVLRRSWPPSPSAGVNGVTRGEWEEQTGGLKWRMGHQPIAIADFLYGNCPVVIPESDALIVNRAA